MFLLGKPLKRLAVNLLLLSRRHISTVAVQTKVEIGVAKMQALFVWSGCHTALDIACWLVIQETLHVTCHVPSLLSIKQPLL